MTFWLLYFAIDGQFVIDYPYHFSHKETCDKIGREITKTLKYEGYRCVKEVRE